MDLFGMLIWAAVLVSLIIFIILLVKSYKSWGLLHTILLSLLFVFSWTFVFLSASVSNQRLTYQKAVDKESKKLEKLKKEVDLLTYGDRNSPNLDLGTFVPLSNELNRTVLERGRVWRNARKQSATVNTATFELPTAVSNLPVAPPAGVGNAAAPAPAATENPGLAIDSVVYLFGESVTPDGLVPSVYLGEFVVTDVKDRSTTVRPTSPLNKVQSDAVQGAYDSWAVYELIPLDSHTAFATKGSKSEEDEIHGHMDKEALAKLLGIDPALATAEPSSLKGTDASKARMLQSYVLDGTPGNEQTPPEALWYRVKFVKDFVVDDIDVGSGSAGNDPTKDRGRAALDGGYFDNSGRTTDARLMREPGEAVRFKVNDTYVFDATAANKLQKDGYVTFLGPIFVRPLNDYEFGFRETRRQTIRAQHDLLLVTRELNEAIRTEKVTLEQEKLRTIENRQLKLDMSQYEKERDVVSGEVVRLVKEIKTLKADLSQLYATVIELHSKIVKRTKELADFINAQAPLE